MAFERSDGVLDNARMVLESRQEIRHCSDGIDGSPIEQVLEMSASLIGTMLRLTYLELRDNIVG